MSSLFNSQTSSEKKRFAPVWVQWVANFVFIIVILSLGFSFFQGLAAMKTPPPREEPKPNVLRVQTFRVEAIPLKRYLSSFGTAQPDIEVIVSAEVSGKVTEKMDFEVGDEVQGPKFQSLQSGESKRKPGSLLIQIDPKTYLEKKKQVEHLIDQNKVGEEKLILEKQLNEDLIRQQEDRLLTVTADYERLRDLFRRGVENETRVNQSLLELEQYRENMKRLENQEKLIPVQIKELLKQRETYESDRYLADLEFEKATVRAPISGIVSEVFVEEGQYVRTGDQLVQITNRNRVEVPIAVSVTDADILQQLIERQGELQVDLVAKEIDFNNVNSRKWTGRITRIDPVADVQTRTVQVFVEVDNKTQPSPLRPGTFVYARIEANTISAEKGFFIPRDALLNGRLYVAVSDNSSESEYQLAEERIVEVAETYQTFAFITSGLSADEEIITTNLDIITEGSLLDVRETHNLEGELKRLRIPYLVRIDQESK